MFLIVSSHKTPRLPIRLSRGQVLNTIERSRKTPTEIPTFIVHTKKEITWSNFRRQRGRCMPRNLSPVLIKFDLRPNYSWPVPDLNYKRISQQSIFLIWSDLIWTWPDLTYKRILHESLFPIWSDVTYFHSFLSPMKLQSDVNLTWFINGFFMNQHFRSDLIISGLFSLNFDLRLNCSMFWTWPNI